MAVRGDARQVLEFFQFFGELPLLRHQRLVVFRQLLGRVQKNLAEVAVDDQRPVFHGKQRQIDRSHNGRNVQRARKDRHVGVSGSLHGHDSLQPFRRRLQHHRWGDLLAHQNRVTREVNLLLADILQIGQHPLANLANVRGALADVRIFHPFEIAYMLLDHLAQRALGPLTLADLVTNIARQGVVIKHVQIRIEQRQLLRRQAPGELLDNVLDVRTNRIDGAVKHGQLDHYVFDFAIGHSVQIGDRLHNHRFAYCDALRTRHAGESEIA